MQTYRRGEFALDFVDPEADAHLLGDRYCWGAYLWQLRDGAGRELLAGPEFPHPRPVPFNGQGLPEVFRSWDKQQDRLLNIDPAGTGLVLGVGRVRVVRGRELAVDAPCRWEVAADGDDLVWRTRDALGRRGYDLERRWSVAGRRLQSASRVRNRGEVPLAVHWYPHPFFPLVPGGTRFAVVPPVAMAGDHPGYRPTGDGWCTTPACNTQAGCFEWLAADYGDRLRWTVAHPVCGAVAVVGAFATAYLPVWCNRATISLEPHRCQDLAPGEETAWWIEYSFAGAEATA